MTRVHIYLIVAAISVPITARYLVRVEVRAPDLAPPTAPIRSASSVVMPPKASIAPPPAAAKPLPESGPARADQVEATLAGLYKEMLPNAKSWNKDREYDAQLQTILRVVSLKDLAPVLTQAAPSDEAGKERHAEARVVALKMFETAVREGKTADAAALIATVGDAVRQNGDVARNQHLDLEAMVRIYIGANPAAVQSEEAFRQTMDSLGLSLAQVRSDRLETPYGQGVIVGLLTGAAAHDKLDSMKTWLTANTNTNTNSTNHNEGSAR